MLVKKTLLKGKCPIKPDVFSKREKYANVKNFI